MNVTPIYLDRLARALAAEGVRLPRTRLLAVAAEAFGCRNVHELSAHDRKGDIAPREAIDLGTTDVAHIGRMRFMRDPSGYVYAIQDDRMETGRGKGWHLAPLGGLAHVDMSRTGPVQLPGSTGSQDPQVPYLLTDSDCEHVGGRNADVSALGVELGSFQNHFYPLDDVEQNYVFDDSVTSTSGTRSVRAGYSAMYRRSKHVAPTAEFHYAGDYDVGRDDALADAREFSEAVRPRVLALGGEIILREDTGDVYGDPAHTVMILIPIGVAIATGTPEAWRDRLAEIIDTPRMEENDDIRVQGPEFAVILENIGEGQDGDYDPTDPDDEPLFRFYVERLVDGRWEYVEDSSYCTQIRADVSRERAEAAARFLLQRVEEHGGPRLKRLCESLSWIGMGDVERPVIDVLVQ